MNKEYIKLSSILKEYLLNKAIERAGHKFDCEGQWPVTEDQDPMTYLTDIEKAMAELLYVA